MTEKVVVFGGAGFIGTRLLRRLVHHAGVAPISFDIRQPNVPVVGVDYRIADVRDLSGVSLPEGVVRIYNLAAVHTTPGHPTHEYYETNIAGGLEITRLAAQADVREIVFTSSISVYGPGEETKTEDTALAPASAYGFSKMLTERVHRAWQSAGPGRKLVIVRPAVVFGPGEGGNFTRMAKLLKKGIFVYPGRKDTIKACIYVEDLLDAIEFARHNVDTVVTFNGAYPQRYSIEQIVDAFKVYFPSARELMIPYPIVASLARVLGVMDFLHLGVHPDRVMKLVRSTDISPSWLLQQGWTFPGTLADGLEKWQRESGGSFV